MNAATDTLLSFAAFHKTRLLDEERDKRILQEAKNQALASDAPLKTIIGNLAEFSFRHFSLLPHEFIEKIEERRGKSDGHQLEQETFSLTDLLIDGFIQNLRRNAYGSPTESSVINDPDSPVYQRVYGRLTAFLRSYDLSDRTLSEFVATQQALYPEIHFFDIFESDETVRNLLAEKMKRAAPAEVERKYKNIFNENKESFIREFLFKRVIRYKEGKFLSVNAKNLEALITYLHSQNYQLEELYDFLYRTVSKMRREMKIQDDVREDVERAAPGILMAPSDDEDTGILHPKFNFDIFFRDHFVTPIKKVREVDMVAKPRPLDLQAKGMDYLIVPEKGMRPFVEMADLALTGNSRLFMNKVRSFFGYTTIKGESQLGSDAIETILSRQLGFAAKQIQYTITHGLKMRPKDDPIHEDFVFQEPIIACRDVKKLIVWFVYPHKFIEDFPEYSHVPRKIIHHQARRMLEYLVLYREHAFDDEFKYRYEKRDRLERHVRGRLNIKDDKLETHSFRILIEIDPNTHEPMKKKKNGDDDSGSGYHYEVLFPNDELWPTDITDDEEISIEKDGRFYRGFPVEQKTFLHVQANVPVSQDSPRRMTLLFYTQDKHLLSCKSLESYLSSFVRGKVPTDLIRWMECTLLDAPREDNEALTDVAYEYASHPIKAVDGSEGRDISKKAPAKKRSAGSTAFAAQRGQTLAAYAILPEPITAAQALEDAQTLQSLDPSVDLEEAIDAAMHGKYPFERQFMDMAAICAASSDYTEMSHRRSYTPLREFEIACQKLFPPLIHGQKFADYYLQGYRGEKEI